MSELLTWLEGSALGATVRGMGVWSYGLFNLAHILGISTLFGSILVLDLRLLGLWRRIGLDTIATTAIPLAAVGFTIAILSGICMISANAIDYIGNPFIFIKFPAIALGLINAVVVSFLPAWQTRGSRRPLPHEKRQLAVAGGTSLACWLTAVSAGRMIGYW